MTTERLLQIKKQIDDAKTKQSEITGQIKSTTDQMFQKFAVKTLQEAEKKLKTMGDELDKNEAEFTTGLKKLEESYSWGD